MTSPARACACALLTLSLAGLPALAFARVPSGTTGNDTIVGNDRPNRIMALGGRDRVIGNGSDDVVYGGKGDDVIDGGDGNDWITAQPGRDHVLGGLGDDRRDALSDEADGVVEHPGVVGVVGSVLVAAGREPRRGSVLVREDRNNPRDGEGGIRVDRRSEEHTSELQSH